jgi:mono/diheme cytochrome c family protein
VKRIAVSVIVGIGMLVAARAASAQAPAAAGAAVFTAQKCSLCHAIAGKGNAKGALDGIGTKLTADEIRRWIVTPVEMAKAAKAVRKPPMLQTFAKLPKADLDALVGYLASLKAAK